MILAIALSELVLLIIAGLKIVQLCGDLDKEMDFSLYLQEEWDKAEDKIEALEDRLKMREEECI